MKRFVFVIGVAAALFSINASAEGYQHGWKVYERPQSGATYGSRELNPYGAGGSKSYGEGGGRSYGEGGGRNPSNPWRIAD